MNSEGAPLDLPALPSDAKTRAMLGTNARMSWLQLSPILAALVASSCVFEHTTDVASNPIALAHSGPWVIPAAVEEIADMQTVTMTEAGPWIGTSGCSGTFTEGAHIFGDYMRENFPQISSYGGYDCRPIVGLPDQMSVHGTGRALDLFIPVDSSVSGEGNADNDRGDAVANWLIANAEYIGIQRVIWDRWMWESEPYGPTRGSFYDWEGSHPHNDHIHMELSVEASTMGTAFFSGPMDPPIPATCAALVPSGGVVDNSDSCFQSFGNATYWRNVTGAGIGGSYIWTNAFRADEPSNWARWLLNIGAAGTYRVEIHLVAEHAIYETARYGVAHAGTTSTITVDQSAADGWVSLGEYDFTTGAGQSVSIYDNSTTAVASGQNICVDAVRLTNLDPAAPDAGPPDAGPADSGMSGGDAGMSFSDSGVTGDDASVETDAATVDPADGGVMNSDGGSTLPPSTRQNSGCGVTHPSSSTTSVPIFFVALLLGVALRRRTRSRI